MLLSNCILLIIKMNINIFLTLNLLVTETMKSVAEFEKKYELQKLVNL